MTATVVAARNETGGDVRGEGGAGKSETAPVTQVSGSSMATGAKRSMSVVEEEEELRDALSRSRPAEVGNEGSNTLFVFPTPSLLSSCEK